MVFHPFVFDPYAPPTPFHKRREGISPSPGSYQQVSIKLTTVRKLSQRAAVGFVRLAKVALAAELACGTACSHRDVDVVRVVGAVDEEVTSHTFTSRSLPGDRVRAPTTEYTFIEC